MHFHRALGLHQVFGLSLYVYILGSVAVEMAWYLLVWRRAYPWREMFASIGVYVLRFPAKFLRPLIIAPVAFFIYAHRLTTIPLNTFWGLSLLFLGEEFAYYWMHRSAHEIRWMWASHVVHHTPKQIHFASAFRLGVTEILSGGWLFHLPLYFIGLNPLAVGAMEAVNLFYQFWLHTDIVGRLGPIEWVLNTPSHHRVHHASNREYIDRNYGGIIIIWDRLFGTFTAERSDTKIRYGLASPFESLNPLRIAFHEWAAMAKDVSHATSWKARWTQLFGRPGESLASRHAADPGKPLMLTTE